MTIDSSVPHAIMRKILLFTLVLALTVIAKTSYAEKAVIALYKSGCDYFIAANRNGYYLLEWYGGYDPTEGDNIVGSLSSYGFHDVYYPSADAEGHIYIEDFWLSKESALEQYIEHCN